MHKPAQVELQLDWSQLPYPAHSDPLPQKAAQPNAQYTKKTPTIYIYIYIYIEREREREREREKKIIKK